MVHGVFCLRDAWVSKRQKAQRQETPYIYVLGSTSKDVTGTITNPIFTPEEEARFVAMSRDENIYEVIKNSMAPSIFGHDDIKRALVCLLFGGSRKELPDGAKLRGDVNVLLLGDPGTAKSQFLKFTQTVRSS